MELARNSLLVAFCCSCAAHDVERERLYMVDQGLRTAAKPQQTHWLAAAPRRDACGTVLGPCACGMSVVLGPAEWRPWSGSDGLLDVHLRPSAVNFSFEVFAELTELTQRVCVCDVLADPQIRECGRILRAMRLGWRRGGELGDASVRRCDRFLREAHRGCVENGFPRPRSPRVVGR